MPKYTLVLVADKDGEAHKIEYQAKDINSALSMARELCGMQTAEFWEENQLLCRICHSPVGKEGFWIVISLAENAQPALASEDLNELLFQHQIALMNMTKGARRVCQADRALAVSHERSIRSLRRKLGVQDSLLGHQFFIDAANEGQAAND